MKSLISEVNKIRSLLKAQDRVPIHLLAKDINDSAGCQTFPRMRRLIDQVGHRLFARGFPPFRVQASYFSQNGPCSHLEISWLRNDLMASLTHGSSRTTVSHGPGFRFVITGNGTYAQMGTRHSLEARRIFLKNLGNPASCQWIDRSLRGLDGDTISVQWTKESIAIRTLDDLREVAKRVIQAKDLASVKSSYFDATRFLERNQLQDEDRLPYTIAGFFAKTATLFWAHHFLLDPRRARSRRQMNYQKSSEQLRKEALRIESRCQNADCPLGGGNDRT